MIKLSRRKRAIYPDWCHYPKLVATDATATERLPDVDQDYGIYMITRTNALPSGYCDTSYAMTVGFDMIYDSAFPHAIDNRAAQPGIDYTLAYYRKNVSNQGVVTYAWTALTPVSSTSPLLGGTETRYRYTLEIPTGDTEVKVYLMTVPFRTPLICVPGGKR